MVHLAFNGIDLGEDDERSSSSCCWCSCSNGVVVASSFDSSACFSLSLDMARLWLDSYDSCYAASAFVLPRE